MGRGAKMITTNLKCEECSNIFNIPRKHGEKRDRGHIKHIWCYKCKKETAHKDFNNDYDIIGNFSLEIKNNCLQDDMSMV